jgi:hypothetical protein
MPRVRLSLTAILIAAVGACTSGGAECTEPPEDELLTVDSAFEVTVEPNPVIAGAEATLSVSPSEETPSDFIGGLGADWECWNGSEWVQTHTLVRGANGPATVVDLSTDSTNAIPDLGLQVPNSHPIFIPEVTPGTHRLTDRLFANESNLTGYVIIEVTEG